MDWITALLGGLGSVVGGVIGQQGADAAAKQQTDALKRAIDMQTGNLKTVIGLQKGTTDKIIGNQTDATNRAVDQQNTATWRSIEGQRHALTTAKGGLMPWLDAGKKALTQYQGELGLTKVGPDGKPFKSEFRNTPGYQFQVDEGEKGAVNNLRALGLGGSGAALKALTRFRTGLADQTYGKYMDRLNGVSQDGENAANTMGGWETQTGANIANTRMGGATNNNNTIMSGANSVNSAIQSGTNNLTDAYINGGNNIANNVVDMGTAGASGTAGGTNAWLKALGNGMNGAGTALGSYGQNWDFLGKAA